MSNLNIENLNRIVQTGDAESLMGGQGPASEVQVAREMQTQGMKVPDAAENAGSFTEMLKKSVESVNQDQVQANVAIDNLIAGRNKNIHETMLAVDRADTSLKLMMQVRNKILDAYREVMRMQV